MALDVLRQLRDTPALITYEKTPDYLPNATALKSIYSLIPSVSLIFMLRDPSSRAYSAYQHHCRKGRFYEGPSFIPRGGRDGAAPRGALRAGGL